MATFQDRIGKEAFSGVQGYKLPVVDIANTVTTLTGYWKEGVQQIQGKYQKALGLNPTLQQSRDFLNSTMTEIDGQIKEVSSKDLSIQDNVARATNLFKPIFNGKTEESRKTLIDSQLTDFYKNQFSQAESYKTKNGGKEYHTNNVKAVQMAYEEFRTEGNWDNLEKFNNTREGYTPFYDDSKERQELLKACPGNNISSVNLSNGQFTTITNKSKSESQVLGCLDNLSDKSKQQTRIDGIVAYGKDYNALRQDYISTAEKKIKHYTDELSDLETQKTALQGDTSPEAQKRVKELDEMIDQYKTGIQTNNERLNGVTKQGVSILGYKQWDETYMKEHYKDLAYEAYAHRKNESFASSFASTSIKEEVKRDPYYIAQFIQGEMNKRAAMKESGEASATAKMNDPLKGFFTDVSKNGGVGIPTGYTTAEQTVTPGYQELKANEVKYNKQLEDFDKVALSQLKELLPNTPAVNITRITTEEQLLNVYRQVETYIANAPKGDKAADDLVKWKNDRAKITTERDLNRIIYLQAEDKVNAQNPGLKDQIQEQISAKRAVLNAVVNDVYHLNSPAFQSLLATLGMTTGIPPNIVAKGLSAVYDYINNYNPESAFETKVNEVLKNDLATQRNVVQLGEIFGPKSSYRGILQPALSSLGKMDEGYEVITAGNYDPVTGTVPINVNTIEKGVRTPLSSDEIEAAAVASKSTIIKQVDGRAVVTIPGVPLLPPPSFEEQTKQIVNYSEKQLSAANPSFITQGVYGKDRREYSIKVTLNPGGTYGYVVLRSGKPIPTTNKYIPEKEAVLADFQAILGAEFNRK